MLVEHESAAAAASVLTGSADAPSFRAARLARRLPVILAAADVLILLAAFLMIMLRLESYTFDLKSPDPLRILVWCTVLAIIWLPLATNMGVYKPAVFVNSIQSGYVTAKAVLIVGALFHIVPLVGGPVYSRVASMTVVMGLVAVMLIWRVLLARVMPLATRPTELVVLGAGWAGQTLAAAIDEHPQSGMRIIAFVDNDPERLGKVEAGVRVQPLSELARLVQQPGEPARVVIAIPDEAHASVYDQLTALAQGGIEVLSMASVYEQVTGRVPVRHLGNFWWAMLPRPTTDIVYLGGKRLVDVTLAIVGLALLGILLPFIAVLQRFDSPGPLFFRQMRVGRYGRPLALIKIRTLHTHDSREFASYWERKRANEASRLGTILRATGIDELPQCWNVLKGEMSIVGPRPYVPEEVEDFQRQIPFFRGRSLAKPGLTGWAQVNWGYGLTLEDEIEKLQYDLYYVGHQCFYLDLLIILRTLAISLRRRLQLRSRYRPGPALPAIQLSPPAEPK